jgi:UDPglucose 6-dehydrogenase
MRLKTVGIIGNGFVGNAIYENLKNRIPTKIYDILPEKTVNSYDQVISSEIVFVCLPTPMGEDGRCDASYVWKFFEEVPPQTDGLFVLKSTVPIGTTEKIKKSRQDLRIIHNPEFLTADNAKKDFFNCDRNVFGGDYANCLELRKFLYSIFPEWESVPYFYVTSTESEIIKYFSNCYLAVKVAYFNNVFQTCNQLGVEYDSVRNAICSDPRINSHHTKVPGPDGKFGFGGYCFPKDINALIHSLNDCGIDSSVLASVWNYNQTIRGSE